MIGEHDLLEIGKNGIHRLDGERLRISPGTPVIATRMNRGKPLYVVELSIPVHNIDLGDTTINDVWAEERPRRFVRSYPRGPYVAVHYDPEATPVATRYAHEYATRRESVWR